MVFNEILTQNQNLIVIGRALVLILIGIFLGFVTKHLLRKFVDIFFLKRFFRRDINVYEASFKILKIITELIQWVIIIILVNYSLLSFEFNVISDITRLVIQEMPNIIIFGVILSVGIILSKIISSNIKKRDIDKKEEIGLIVEIIIVSAFILAAFEYVGIKATAITELYKVILYVVGAIIVVLFIKYELFSKKSKKR